MDSFISSPLISYQPISSETNRNSSQLVIRTAQTQDIHSLAEILTHSFYSCQGFLWWMYPLLKLGIYEDLRSRLNSRSPNYICLVAAIPTADKIDRVVGTVEISLRSPSFWSTYDGQYPYISNLAVSNSYRRQGAARKLLLKCEQIALNWGFKEIALHVLENNYQARQLYSSTGYELHRIESSLSNCFWMSPRRLLLNKQMSKPIISANDALA